MKAFLSGRIFRRICAFLGFFLIGSAIMSSSLLHLSDSSLPYLIYAAKIQSASIHYDAIMAQGNTRTGNLMSLMLPVVLQEWNENLYDYLNGPGPAMQYADTVTSAQPRYTPAPRGFVYLPEVPMSEELQKYTWQRCENLGLEYELILAIMWRESGFQVHAVNVNTNGTRDNGLMQINDVNRSWLMEDHGITDLMDPYQNIDAGTAILSVYTRKHGTHNALLAYHYGEQGMLVKLEQGVTTNRQLEVALEQRNYYRQLIASRQV